MKVKYFKPDVLRFINPPIITIGQIVQAYMPVDRTDTFNPFNMVYEPIPTTENFAKILYECITEKLKCADCKLRKVRLYETKDLFVEYWKEQ